MVMQVLLLAPYFAIVLAVAVLVICYTQPTPPRGGFSPCRVGGCGYLLTGRNCPKSLGRRSVPNYRKNEHKALACLSNAA
jgi:hypothetical protein